MTSKSPEFQPRNPRITLISGSIVRVRATPENLNRSTLRAQRRNAETLNPTVDSLPPVHFLNFSASPTLRPQRAPVQFFAPALYRMGCGVSRAGPFEYFVVALLGLSSRRAGRVSGAGQFCETITNEGVRVRSHKLSAKRG